MAIGSIAERLARDAAKADLEQLKPFAFSVEAGEHQMGA